MNSGLGTAAGFEFGTFANDNMWPPQYKIIVNIVVTGHK